MLHINSVYCVPNIIEISYLFIHLTYFDTLQQSVPCVSQVLLHSHSGHVSNWHLTNMILHDTSYSIVIKK